MFNPSRRQWLLATPGIAYVVAQPMQVLGATAEGPVGSLHNGFPQQDPELVRRIVGASHGNIELVRELVEASPALARASWDWGFGDWESALGAASHVGRHDIVELLIHHGARPNLFTLAMMGHLDAVRSVIQAMPGIQKTHGPHGITLLAHARFGGDRSAGVARYLETVDGTDDQSLSKPITQEQQQVYLGRYRFGKGSDECLQVSRDRRGDLIIQRGDNAGRRLLRVEENGFAPAGASDVRIRFDVADGQALRLTVHDPMPIVKALRD